MSKERKKRFWLWIVTVLIGLPVLYVASFGPSCWVTSRTGLGADALPIVYKPIVRIWDATPEPIAKAIGWYAEVGAPEGWGWWRTGATFTWCHRRRLPALH